MTILLTNYSENNMATKEIKKVPTLSELYGDKQAMIKQNELNLILNSEPKAEWVKIHPMTKQKYLPIERVEYLLTVIFGSWYVEIKEIKVLANSVVTTVRVYVKNPLTGEMQFQDGVGAMPIQIKKDSGSAIDFANMKSNAIQLGAPASESYAIKDACEKFGKIFGKDINRKDSIDYVDRIHAMVASMNEPNLAQEIINKILNCTTEEQLKEVWEENRGLGKDFAKLVKEQKDFINEVTKDEYANS
jgi:recombination DNA repair RAD52 pathway protein